jgi:hypothetical protein
VHLQTTAAAEIHLDEGLTSGRWRTSKAETSLTDPVGTGKLTLFVKTLSKH